MSETAAAAPLAERLAPHLSDAGLLELALTHRSFCAEHPGSAANERLEFLGDAVLGLVVASALYAAYPNLSEGDLSRVRATLVSSDTLAPVAAALGIGDALRLGRGEERSGGRAKPSILADALEAVIGAVFLSGGPGAAGDFVRSVLGGRLVEEAERAELGDAKNRLQELCARRGFAPPAYELEDAGPEHARTYRATVRVDGRVQGAGSGPSKKAAERAAATEALAVLGAAPFDA